ncbi:MAG: DoxX protein [Acidobacteria bacterium]|nr:MAG: DoxX protein [Acidobacteriota bacterium]
MYLRLALGTAFLSAVADRFGIWGRAGAPRIAWGNFHNFLLYAAKLNPWFPASWVPAIGWMATVCEVGLGIVLILGFRARLAAFLSGLLLLAFALGMAFGLGIKAPLDASVFTASAASFLLASVAAFPWSLDALLSKSK